MAATRMKARPVWDDRFRTPGVEHLLGAFPKQLGGVVEHARGKLLAVAGVQEEVSWQGVWKWTLLYRLPEHGDGRAWVYVVPDPARPRMAVPVAEARRGGCVSTRSRRRRAGKQRLPQPRAPPVHSRRSPDSRVAPLTQLVWGIH